MNKTRVTQLFSALMICSVMQKRMDSVQFSAKQKTECELRYIKVAVNFQS